MKVGWLQQTFIILITLIVRNNTEKYQVLDFILNTKFLKLLHQFLKDKLFFFTGEKDFIPQICSFKINSSLMIMDNKSSWKFYSNFSFEHRLFYILFFYLLICLFWHKITICLWYLLEQLLLKVLLWFNNAYHSSGNKCCFWQDLIVDYIVYYFHFFF